MSTQLRIEWTGSGQTFDYPVQCFKSAVSSVAYKFLVNCFTLQMCSTDGIAFSLTSLLVNSVNLVPRRMQYLRFGLSNIASQIYFVRLPKSIDWQISLAWRSSTAIKSTFSHNSVRKKTATISCWITYVTPNELLNFNGGDETCNNCYLQQSVTFGDWQTQSTARYGRSVEMSGFVESARHCAGNNADSAPVGDVAMVVDVSSPGMRWMHQRKGRSEDRIFKWRFHDHKTCVVTKQKRKQFGVVWETPQREFCCYMQPFADKRCSAHYDNTK